MSLSESWLLSGKLMMRGLVNGGALVVDWGQLMPEGEIPVFVGEVPVLVESETAGLSGDEL